MKHFWKNLQNSSRIFHYNSARSFGSKFSVFIKINITKWFGYFATKRHPFYDHNLGWPQIFSKKKKNREESRANNLGFSYPFGKYFTKNRDRSLECPDRNSARGQPSHNAKTATKAMTYFDLLHVLPNTFLFGAQHVLWHTNRHTSWLATLNIHYYTFNLNHFFFFLHPSQFVSLTSHDLPKKTQYFECYAVASKWFVMQFHVFIVVCASNCKNRS